MHAYDLILTLTGGLSAALVLGYITHSASRPLSDLRDLSPLKEAGADTAYSGEGEVALAFVEDILETLGATPEQIDRGRAHADAAVRPDLSRWESCIVNQFSPSQGLTR